jgi:hypothetical protein
MQFVLLIYHGGMLDAGSASKEEEIATYADYAALNRMENMTPGPPLGLPENATTVRVQDGSTVTTDGPYIDVKSAVGGFFVLDAESLDAAVEIASRIPQARLGGAVEVRPAEKYW